MPRPRSLQARRTASSPTGRITGKALLACEESQEVTKALRAKGVEAYSCDVQPCSGGHPEWHIQEDVRYVLDGGWDMVLAFPPCTHLAVSGARWFPEKRMDGSQREAIEFFMMFVDCAPKWGIENPIGIISGSYIKKYFPRLCEKYGLPRKPSQIIQPWQFGHGETKATCLWLGNLPPLKPTNVVDGRDQRVWRLPPSDDRAKLRSKTYAGVAQAIAEQWVV